MSDELNTNIPRLKDQKKKSKPRDTAKYYNSKYWHKLRNRYLMMHPLCEICLAEGKVTPAEHIHHRIPFGQGVTEEQRWQLLTDETNLQALCLAHHKAIHNEINKQRQEKK